MATPSRFRVTSKLLTIIAASLLLGASVSSAAVIYQEDFSGGNTGLNNTAPDVRPEGSSATWVAGSGFRENGSFTGTASTGQTAWLPYTFQNGQIYEVSMTLSFVPDAASTKWLSLAFTDRPTLNSAAMNITDQAGPYAMGWALLRQDGDWKAFGGRGTTPALGIGESTNHPFAGALTNATIRLVLDTRGSNYLLSLYINDVQLDLTGTGLNYTFPAGQQFTGIGFGGSASDIGTFQQFTFSAIPEPSSVALLAVGGVVAVSALRRLRRA